MKIIKYNGKAGHDFYGSDTEIKIPCCLTAKAMRKLTTGKRLYHIWIEISSVNNRKGVPNNIITIDTIKCDENEIVEYLKYIEENGLENAKTLHKDLNNNFI